MAAAVSRVTTSALLAGALVAVAAAPLLAQGKSGQPHGHSGAPSTSPLPIAPPGATGLGAVPLAWVDDANLMEPGAMTLDVSIARWQGNGIGETDAPVFNVAAGVTKRFQFAATVPRVTGNDAAGVVGGLGTTYFSGKYAAYANEDVGLKVAVAPTLEVLGTGLIQALGPDESRTQFGLPVSLELDRGGRRLYASTGWFSRGVWFAGAGAAFNVQPKTGVSVSFSRSWTSADAVTGLSRDRTELSGGASYGLTPHVSVFGSLGHTIATTDENGAGATFAGGVSFYVSPAAPQKPRK